MSKTGSNRAAENQSGIQPPRNALCYKTRKEPDVEEIYVGTAHNGNHVEWSIFHSIAETSDNIKDTDGSSAANELIESLNDENFNLAALTEMVKSTTDCQVLLKKKLNGSSKITLINLSSWLGPSQNSS